MNLKEEAKRIAKEALEESADVQSSRLRLYHAQELIRMICYNHRFNQCDDCAIKVFTEQDTWLGIKYLEEYGGGVARPGDTFAGIARRISWATLVRTAFGCLAELKQKEPNE